MEAQKLVANSLDKREEGGEQEEGKEEKAIGGEPHARTDVR